MIAAWEADRSALFDTTARADLVAELCAATAILGRALLPRTAANLADLVRIMNTYYAT